ncbi:MAG TPA: hypothetical protein VFR35_20115 [Actinoplanes sp.]|nr:hypothetical protein [Actinoplanes sp.]
MTHTWRHLPVAARPIGAAIEAAVIAAETPDREAMADAVAELAALDQVQVGLVLGTAVRLLLEERHPDGLTGDDIKHVLKRTVAEFPEADPQVVWFLLAGALGVHADGPPVSPELAAWHATFLLAGAPIRPLIERAMQEIEQTQLND